MFIKLHSTSEKVTLHVSENEHVHEAPKTTKLDVGSKKKATELIRLGKKQKDIVGEIKAAGNLPELTLLQLYNLGARETNKKPRKGGCQLE